MKVKKIYAGMMAMLAMMLLVASSCSDNEFYNSPLIEDDGDNARITFTVNVPEAQVVMSRAGSEDDLQNLAVLVFDGSTDAAKLQQIELIAGSDLEVVAGSTVRRKFTVSLKKADAQRYVYMVANVDETTLGALKSIDTDATNPSTLANVRDITSSSLTSPYAMSGMKMVSKIPNLELVNSDFSLIRSVAKVTTEVDAAVTDFTLEGFSVYHGNTSGSILAGVDIKDTDIPPVSTMTGTEYQSADAAPFTIYTFPSSGKSESGVNTYPFLVIKGTYDGTSGYYRVNMKSAGTQLTIHPNHHYKVVVKKVTGKGFSTAEEAVKNSADLVAEIYDIQPQIYNMISDGSHELGVNDTTWIESSTAAIDGEIKIKYFPGAAAGMTIVPAADTDWLTVADTPESAETLTGTETGTLYIYKVTANANPSGIRREGKVTVTVGSLSRDIVVVQRAKFLSNEFGTIQLFAREYTLDADRNITGSTDLDVSSDYWKFIRNEDPSTTLFGISPEAMGGKVRTEGFHMVMSDQMQFIYKYTLDPTTDEHVKAYNGWTWKLELDPIHTERLLFWSHDANFKNTAGTETLPVGGMIGGTNETDKGFIFTNKVISLSGKDAHRYGSKTFRIVLTPPTGSTESAVTYAYDLYRTGIFNYNDGTGKYQEGSNKVEKGWYYYEVIYMGNNYWLDRNLGAKSSGYYIRESDGTSLLGNTGWPYLENSQGGLFYVADGTNGDTGNPQPAMIEDMCPKGFRVPYMKEYNDLIADSRFHTDYVDKDGLYYWDSSFSGEHGVVRFPRCGMWYSGNAGGVARAGYYWTRTPAIGASGTERGMWLQFVKFAGTNVTTGRYRTKDAGGNRAAMSLRCVYDAAVEETTYTTEFYVQGYTHVYFYYESAAGERTFLNTWPGEMITVYDDAKNNSTAMWRPFIYTSVTNYASMGGKLKVIFFLMDDAGNVIDSYPADGDYHTGGGIEVKPGQYFRRSTNTWSTDK